MRTTIARATLLAASIAAGTSTAGATGRQNPFLPQTTAAEDQAIATKAAMEDTVREMIPEIRQSIERNFERERRETLDEVRRLSAAQAAAAQRPAAGGLQRAVASLKLVSCVNGKALYRDQSTNATVFAKPGSDAQAPCDPQ